MYKRILCNLNNKRGKATAQYLFIWAVSQVILGICMCIKMKFALIGCGRISPNHIAAALESSLDVVGICDIDCKKAEELIRKTGLPNTTKIFKDYKEMLIEEKPDLIAIATESGKHAQIALACIGNGCHVIIEKPIALSLFDADQIIEASKKNNVKVCACHQNRFNKSIKKLREAVEQGRFGHMFHASATIRWNRGQGYYDQAKWRGTWEQDGGALMNQCIHNIDLLRWMMGDDITEVMGFTDNLNHDYIEAEDLGMAMIKFSNGSYGIVEGTTNIYPKNLEETLYLFGEKGTVKVGGKSVNVIQEWMFADNSKDLEIVKSECNEDPPSVYGYGHTPLYADMIEAIVMDRSPYVDAHAGRQALETVLAIYLSSKTGSIIKLPLQNCSTMDFKGEV